MSDEVIGSSLLLLFVLLIGWVLLRWWREIIQWIIDTVSGFLILAGVLAGVIIVVPLCILATPIVLPWVGISVWRQKRKAKKAEQREAELTFQAQLIAERMRPVIRQEIQTAIERA